MSLKKNGKKQDVPNWDKLKKLQKRYSVKTSAKARPLIPMKGARNPHFLCPDTGYKMNPTEFMNVIKKNKNA